jgi:hypothetical protein
MKAKACIVYRVDDDEYNVYESMNGGDEYWVHDLLQKYVGDDEKRVHDLFGKSIEKLDAGTEENKRVEIGDGDVIEETPIAKGITKREVNKMVPNAGTEIVFVVDEDEIVDSFIPVNTSPTVIDGLIQETTIELFDNGVTKYDVLEDGVEPVVRFDDNEDVMGVIDDGGIEEQFLEQYHRCFADLYVDMKNRSEKERWVTVGEFNARIVVNDVMSEYEMVNIGLPVQVTWKDSTPSYEMYCDEMNAYGGLAKVFGSQLRLKIHPEYEKVLKTIEQNEITEETVARSIQPITDKMIQQIRENFTGEILFEYTTEAFQENIELIT